MWSVSSKHQVQVVYWNTKDLFKVLGIFAMNVIIRIHKKQIWKNIKECAGSDNPGGFMPHVGSLWVSLGVQGKLKMPIGERISRLIAFIYKFPNGKDALLDKKGLNLCSFNLIAPIPSTLTSSSVLPALDSLLQMLQICTKVFWNWKSPLEKSSINHSLALRLDFCDSKVWRLACKKWRYGLLEKTGCRLE